LSSLLTKKQDKNMNEDIEKQEDTEKHLLDKLPIGVSRSFAFGECVKVLHCFHGHEFEIGEVVCIVGKSDYDDAWLCRNAKGVEWYLHDEEGEVVNCG
jgi:hypothetical protein